MVTATICTIGDEILIGQIIDTNSSKIATQLNAIGVKVCHHISASDNERDILDTLQSCINSTDVVIVTGGLGPTKDDITKKTLAKLTGATGYVKNEEQYTIVKQILSARGIEMSDINEAQAFVPDTCKVIVNECGTAPCMQFEINNGKSSGTTLLFSLPGVPFEAEAALPKVMKSIKEHFKLDNIFHKTICTFGIPESTLAKRIESWEDNLPDNLHLAYLPNPILGVRLRLSIYGANKEQGEKELEQESIKLKKLLGNAVYGEGEDSLQSSLGKILKSRGESISTAESCTGGMIASLITSVSGASEYFHGSVVSYSNDAKINTLKVDSNTILQHGAVSSECVKEMAEGVRKLMNTTYSIATSGIAGPLGGTAEKPVGTVWIAIAGPDFTETLQLHFRGSRKLNIERFASHSIDFLRTKICGLRHS